MFFLWSYELIQIWTLTLRVVLATGADQFEVSQLCVLLKMPANVLCVLRWIHWFWVIFY